MGVGASYDRACASLSNAALAAVTNPVGAPSDAAAAFLCALDPGDDDLFLCSSSESSLISEDEGDRETWACRTPTSGDVGDNS